MYSLHDMCLKYTKEQMNYSGQGGAGGRPDAPQLLRSEIQPIWPSRLLQDTHKLCRPSAPYPPEIEDDEMTLIYTVYFMHPYFPIYLLLYSLFPIHTILVLYTYGRPGESS